MPHALEQFPVTRKWPASYPDVIQLYSLTTPNGIKVSIALEELGLPYEAHRVAIDRNEQMTPEFLSLNPNNKIPAIIDPNGPGGQPIGLFESGAILLYLAEKTARLLPQDPVQRWHAIQWVIFQMGGVGPMFGQLGYFCKFAGKEMEDKRPLHRYATEVRRLLGVLDQHLATREWMMDSGYSMADIAIFPWINTLLNYYEAGDLVHFQHFAHVRRVFDAFLARPAVQRGMQVPTVSE